MFLFFRIRKTERSVRINYIKGQQDIKSMCLGRTYQ